jgi:predicted dehydrogenase
MRPSKPLNRVTRRRFLQSTAAAGATLSLPWLSAKSYAQVPGANDDIRLAVVGCNDCGRAHISKFLALKGCRLTSLCDVDSAVLERASKIVTAAGKPPATGYADVRKVLDNKEIDALYAAPPNHWHALMTIWACQAGKDIYMEKPICHTVWEGRQAVAASRKYNRIVQAGTQWRSMPEVFEAIEYAKSGKLGKILVSRGLCYKPRPPIGNATELKVPPTVDFDLWCGPVSKDQHPRSQFHYDWHWFWETGNGDIGNQGAHQMDLARWALGQANVAPSVLSLGGRLGYHDDGQTPNTLLTVHDYGNALLIFEVRGLPTRGGAANLAAGPASPMDKYRGADIGNVIECEHGYVSINMNQSAAFDNDGKKLQTFTGTGVTRDTSHQENFLKAIRSRNRADLQGELAEGAVSSYLCHLSNISYRTGKAASPDQAKAAFSAPAAAETLNRLHTHLDANNVPWEGVTLGMPLQIDPETVKITGNEPASKLLTQTYRPPFVVPENV